LAALLSPIFDLPTPALAIESYLRIGTNSTQAATNLISRLVIAPSSVSSWTETNIAGAKVLTLTLTGGGSNGTNTLAQVLAAGNTSGSRTQIMGSADGTTAGAMGFGDGVDSVLYIYANADGLQLPQQTRIDNSQVWTLATLTSAAQLGGITNQNVVLRGSTTYLNLTNSTLTSVTLTNPIIIESGFTGNGTGMLYRVNLEGGIHIRGHYDQQSATYVQPTIAFSNFENTNNIYPQWQMGTDAAGFKWAFAIVNSNGVGDVWGWTTNAAGNPVAKYGSLPNGMETAIITAQGNASDRDAMTVVRANTNQHTVTAASLNGADFGADMFVNVGGTPTSFGIKPSGQTFFYQYNGVTNFTIEGGGTITGNGAGLTGVNADLLDGLNSTAFLRTNNATARRVTMWGADNASLTNAPIEIGTDTVSTVTIGGGPWPYQLMGANGEGNPLFSVILTNNVAESYESFAAFGSTASASRHYYRAAGTLANPSTITSGLFFLSEGYRAYDGSAWGGSAFANQIFAPGTWTGSSHPVAWQVQTTDSGTTTRKTAFSLNSDGSLGITGTVVSGIGFIFPSAGVTGSRTQSVAGITNAVSVGAGTSLVAAAGATINLKSLLINGGTISDDGSLVTLYPSAAAASATNVVINILKDASQIAAVSNLNFITGANTTLSVTQFGSRVDVTIAGTGGGSGVAVNTNGVQALSAATTLNFPTNSLPGSNMLATVRVAVSNVSNTADVRYDVAQPVLRMGTSTNLSFTGNVLTKIPYNIVIIDTHGFWDNTNFRYTPTIPGFYFVTVTAAFGAGGDGVGCVANIYTNGIRAAYANSRQGAVGQMFAVCNGTYWLNGATDYIEGWGLTTSTLNISTNSGGVVQTSIDIHRLGGGRP
jgi:hypothetical protein